MHHRIPPSEYNRDQLASFTAIRDACRRLSEAALRRLLERLQPYLEFRRELEAFQHRYLRQYCRRSCFATGLSACCGFESIITFFADQAITFLIAAAEERHALFDVLEHPGAAGKCVFLGPTGCIWRLPPVTCALFLCDRAKQTVFADDPAAAVLWQGFREGEKRFTHPVQPVLFDELERVFLELGAESPHMYFHSSPGLLRLKARAGILDAPWCRRQQR
jgi:hypothetical protein